MPWSAMHRYARISERKARLLVDLIRGRRCDDAVEILRYNHKRAARMVDKVLKSAMANANEQEATVSSLYVSAAWVDAGPVIKRFKAKDRGRAHPILRRTSHINVQVEERG